MRDFSCGEMRALEGIGFARDRPVDADGVFF